MSDMRGPGRGRRAPPGRLPWAGLALSVVLACTTLSPDFDAVVAIEVVVPDSGFLEQGDTLFPRARPLNGRGDSVAAPVTWATLDTAVLQVDSATGAARGKAPGVGRIQARVGTLPSNPIPLVVQPPLDTVEAQGARADTVVLSTDPDGRSDPVGVQVRAEVPAGMTAAQVLVRRRVAFERVTFPGSGLAVTLVPGDTVLTNTAGVAVVQVRFDSGPVPDSVEIRAHVLRHTGEAVPGSPVTFLVEFRP